MESVVFIFLAFLIPQIINHFFMFIVLRNYVMNTNIEGIHLTGVGLKTQTILKNLILSRGLAVQPYFIFLIDIFR